MSPIALTYLILGLIALVWPLAILLLKPRVLAAQWILAVAMLFFSLSFILYSGFFNTFLSGEYLLVILFMLFALLAPPSAMLAISYLTRPQGLRRLSRAFFLLPSAMILLLALSVLIGGPDMYRLWIFRGTSLEASFFFHNSWRYNLIVFVHFYLFYIVLLLQLIILSLHTFRSLRRFRRTLNEYYTSSASQSLSTSATLTINLSILVISLIIALSLALFPFNAPRPLSLILPLSILQALATIALGLATYRLSYGAESLRHNIDRSPRSQRPRDLAALGRQLSLHIEQQGYRDPDLSVFSLSETFHVSQDQVVDAIHRIHGQSFADYIDSLRIQHALSLLAQSSDIHPQSAHLLDDDPDLLLRIAHQCGYPDTQALLRAYRKIMQSQLSIS